MPRVVPHQPVRMKRNRASRSSAPGVPAAPGVRTRWFVFAAAMAAIGVAAALFWRATPVQKFHPTLPKGAPIPVMAMASSAFENTRSDAKYVGTPRCVECHADQHATYLHTAHSRSLSAVDPSQQPSGGVLQHAASGRQYRAYRKDGDLRHSESLPLPGGRELPLCDHRLSYLVGSGRFARTYVVEDAGFFVESPVTWYTSLDKWSMSPGYDAPHHKSFHRTIEHSCLYCHAGICNPIQGNDQRLQLVELAIGCERCHGPGSLHVARHAAGNTQPAPEGDRTIVNPSRLPRELAEAVCHQCHLTSEVQIAVRGRSPADFHPGLQWQDFAIDYGFETAGTEMTVVGHVAQMRQSRCYQQSNSLTCITCHSPHEPIAAPQRIDHHRATCQQCHAEQACDVGLPERITKNTNDCVACHMPQSPTDVPHVAFTHHRIGIHDPAAPKMAASAGFRPLSPMLDISHLPEIDRRRALGLAYLQYHRDHEQEGDGQPYLAQARPLIESTIVDGLFDAPLALAKAELAGAAGDLSAAEEWARRTLIADNLTSKERSSALRMLAGFALQAEDVGKATSYLEKLTALCRDPRDWFLLGVCRQRQGDAPAAIAALERVLQIDPGPPETYELLSSLYAAQGNELLAKQRRERAEAIRRVTAARE